MGAPQVSLDSLSLPTAAPNARTSILAGTTLAAYLGNVRSLLPPLAVVAGLTLWSAFAISRTRSEVVTHEPGVLESPAIATPQPAAPAAVGDIRLTPHSLRIASAARHFVAHRPPRRWRDDCSGFVSAIMTRAKIPMDGRVATIYESAIANDSVHYDPIPSIGDLAFFDNTHDRNENGKWDDLRTHIAVVVDVLPDGTVIMAHHGSERRLIRMNLLAPHVHDGSEGEELNSWLRRQGRGDTFSLYLTGQLWSGFATVKDTSAWLDE